MITSHVVVNILIKIQSAKKKLEGYSMIDLDFDASLARGGVGVTKLLTLM